jgi:hypothetical protein
MKGEEEGRGGESSKETSRMRELPGVRKRIPGESQIDQE